MYRLEALFLLPMILIFDIPAVYSDSGGFPLLGQLFGTVRQHITLSVLSLAATGVVVSWLVSQHKTREYFKQLLGRFRGERHKLNGIKILYGTQTGTAKKLASLLEDEARGRKIPTSCVNIRDYDPEDNLPHEVNSGVLVVIIIATYTDGTPPEDANWFHKWLLEGATDFRLSKNFLEGLEYAVVGLGNSLYQENFCKVAFSVDDSLETLGANHRLLPVGIVDENVSESKHGGKEADFNAWMKDFWRAATVRFKDQSEGKKKSCQCSKPTCGKKPKDDGDQYISSDEDEGEEEIMDIEDLAGVSRGRRSQVQSNIRPKAKKHR